jgi:hypothetical protein
MNIWTGQQWTSTPRFYYSLPLNVSDFLRFSSWSRRDDVGKLYGPLYCEYSKPVTKKIRKRRRWMFFASSRWRGGGDGANSNDRKIAWSSLLIFFHAPSFQPTSRRRQTCDVFWEQRNSFTFTLLIKLEVLNKDCMGTSLPFCFHLGDLQ